jgi:hypothetical protein
VQTFDFGGAGFGLQAFLTTFSNEDICKSQGCLHVTRSQLNGLTRPTFLLWKPFLCPTVTANVIHFFSPTVRCTSY